MSDDEVSPSQRSRQQPAYRFRCHSRHKGPPRAQSLQLFFFFCRRLESQGSRCFSAGISPSLLSLLSFDHELCLEQFETDEDDEVDEAKQVAQPAAEPAKQAAETEQVAERVAEPAKAEPAAEPAQVGLCEGGGLVEEA